MNYFYLIFIAIIACFLDTSFFPYFSVYGSIHLTSLIIIICSIFYGSKTTFILGLISGSILDGLTGVNFGLNVLSLSLSCLFIGKVNEKNIFRTSIINIVIVFSVFLIRLIFLILINFYYSYDFLFFAVLFKVFIINFLLNLVSVYLFLIIFGRIKNFKQCF